jgi:hypothetical protein
VKSIDSASKTSTETFAVRALTSAAIFQSEWFGGSSSSTFILGASMVPLTDPVNTEIVMKQSNT